MLSKFDLSGNPIGSAGLEILAHAYIKSDLDYLEADAEAIIGANAGGVLALAEDVDSLELEKEKENESPRASRAKKPAGKGKAVKQNGTSQSTPATASKNITLADLKKYTCTRGLRSIPYFILSDIALTTRSAIHLSHMIAIQKASEHLITFLPPGKASAIPEAAQNDKSLIWQPNDELATFAKRLLEVTESIREFKSKAESDSEAFTNSEDAQRKLQSKLVIEYTRLTKRVRIETMKLEGVHSSDIAITALKMMVVSRALLLEDKDRPIEELPEDETENSSVETAEEEEQPTRNSSPVGYQPQTFFTFPDSFSLGPFHPDGATFDEEFPALQTAHESKSPTKRGVLGVKGSLESSSGPSQPIRSGKGIPRNSSVAQKARKQEWRFSLPFELWRRIIAGALDADGILDHDQQTRIIRYASDWDAVAYELTIKGAEDHQQIWKFLETVGCFTYTPLP
ncbi:uncharacterized protein BJX67DRAFT_347102 [Aspergillus lucknowensis]|uniref:Leucine rich repeat protein n=1 Tax=Aspergillus lucknowensis TaxID=176173 RepID=A0ABR4M099_9EURO